MGPVGFEPTSACLKDRGLMPLDDEPETWLRIRESNPASNSNQEQREYKALPIPDHPQNYLGSVSGSRTYIPQIESLIS